MARVLLPAVVVCVLSLLSSSHAQCPPYTHKDDVLLGTPSTLPDGWCVFTTGSFTAPDRYSISNGLYRSPLRTFSPTAIPNTTNEVAKWIDISDDGNWILYAGSGGQLRLIRPDGSGKTTVPNATTNSSCGFYRASPNGSELWWVEQTSIGGTPKYLFKAMAVSLATDNVSFGATRTILDNNKDAVTNTWDMAVTGTDYCVAKDQILGVFSIRRPSDAPSVYPQIMRTCYVTIPSNGMGEAGLENVFVWSDDTYQSLYGCGHTMSRGGSLALANSNGIGSACVPNTANDPDMDHKGFYITPFRHTYDGTMALSQHVDVYGTSINWCPPAYRQGAYSDVDFNDWYFANDSTYVIGMNVGIQVPNYGLSFGLWVVHWPTNTWTMLNPATTTTIYREPAIFLTAGNGSRSYTPGRTGSRSPSIRLCFGATTVRLLDGQVGFTLHDPSGRVLWTYRRNNPAGECEIPVPHRLHSSALLVRVHSASQESQ